MIPDPNRIYDPMGLQKKRTSKARPKIGANSAFFNADKFKAFIGSKMKKHEAVLEAAYAFLDEAPNVNVISPFAYTVAGANRQAKGVRAYLRTNDFGTDAAGRFMNRRFASQTKRKFLRTLPTRKSTWGKDAATNPHIKEELNEGLWKRWRRRVRRARASFADTRAAVHTEKARKARAYIKAKPLTKAAMLLHRAGKDLAFSHDWKGNLDRRDYLHAGLNALGQHLEQKDLARFHAAHARDLRKKAASLRRGR